ncbi:MAG: EAL domain-containing protein [Gammaproteobacteria bacterium]|nr:EAL domain-containing protein [Gammaproteobacteria bacterium]
MHLIVDALPVLISYLDTSLCYRYVNKAYSDWFGYQLDRLPGKPLSSLLSESQYKYRKPYLDRALKGEKVSFEGEIRTLNGHRQVQITYVPDIDRQGRVRGINSLVWDITSSKQAGETLRKLQHDYAALINSIEGIVWEADASTFQFTFVSAQVEHILGYSVSTWLSEHNFWENHIHPDDREWVVRSCLEATSSLQNNDFEYRMISASGQTVWLRDIVTVLIEDGVPKLRGVMIDITSQKENEEQLEYLSNYDTLTGLPNRNLFLDRLEQALAYIGWQKRPLAVVSIGINRFKRINESLGHEAGNEALRQMAVFLRDTLRERDTVARIAGNEFALILTEMSREADVARIMEKLFNGLSAPFHAANHDIAMNVSVGISMPPDDGHQADILLKHAEFAMHSAKRRNLTDNNYQHYSENLGNQISDTLALENAIRRAIEKDEFELYYQPQYDMGDNAIVAVEALLRWPRPDTGELVLPDRIIPLAEESGLIIPLGVWVLRRACRDYRNWLCKGMAPSWIAVNISARQFQSAVLVDTIRNMLDEHNMRASHLELELTESVLQTESAMEYMHALAGLGMRIAIDDFGIGYSSLNYL